MLIIIRIYLFCLEFSALLFYKLCSFPNYGIFANRILKVKILPGFLSDSGCFGITRLVFSFPIQNLHNHLY
jgi:hypothetical protein